MKKIWVFSLLLAMVACSSPETGKEALEGQISELKKQRNEISDRISELEKELAALGGKDRFAIPVEVKLIDYEQFDHYFNVRGSVEAIKESYISPEMSGLIERIDVKEGQNVARGQLLAKLNTDIIENNIKEVEIQLEHAEVIFQKQKRLWDRKIGSEMQYLDAKNARDGLLTRLETLKAQLDMSFIRSPIKGQVDEIYMKVGELAMPGQQLMLVINLDELYINADVSETYLARIREGDIVEVSFPVYPEIRLNVPVFRTGNVINPGNRTFTMQLKISNQENKLKPNILSVIRINDFSTPSAMVVPSKVIKQDASGQYLYVVKKERDILISRKKYVETGMSFNDQTMVIDGLELSDKVVTGGFNQVSDGSPVVIKG